MKMQELRAMTTEELLNELERLRRHLFDLRSQAVTEKLENPMQLRNTRRDVARIYTILHSERGVVDVKQKLASLTAQAARR